MHLSDGRPENTEGRLVEIIRGQCAPAVENIYNAVRESSEKGR